MHSSAYRFIQLELGPHPVIIFLLDWVHTGYMALGLPGGDGSGAVNPYQWGHSWPASLQAVLPASIHPVGPSGGGRWENWITNGRPAVMAGGAFELVCTPSDFYYAINGVRQMPGSESGNPPDAWTAAICAAVVGEAKQGLTVFDSNPTLDISNGIMGGTFYNTTRSNLEIEAIT